MRNQDQKRTLEKLLNIKEVAEFLGVKKTMVYRLLSDGTIPTLSLSDSPRCSISAGFPFAPGKGQGKHGINA